MQTSFALVGADVDQEPLTFGRVGGPTNGVAEIRTDPSGASRLFYTARAGFSGVEVIRFVAADGAARTSNIATLSIAVSNPAPAPQPNRPPVAQDASGNAVSGVQTDIPVAGSDPDVDPISFERVGGPVNGVGQFVVVNGQTVLRYTSRANFVGTEIVRFVARDSKGRTSNVATLSIGVAPASGASQSGALQSGGSGGHS